MKKKKKKSLSCFNKLHEKTKKTQRVAAKQYATK